jgi:hypothetical protein
MGIFVTIDELLYGEGGWFGDEYGLKISPSPYRFNRLDKGYLRVCTLR